MVCGAKQCLVRDTAAPTDREGIRDTRDCLVEYNTFIGPTQQVHVLVSLFTEPIAFPLTGEFSEEFIPLNKRLRFAPPVLVVCMVLIRTQIVLCTGTCVLTSQASSVPTCHTSALTRTPRMHMDLIRCGFHELAEGKSKPGDV